MEKQKEIDINYNEIDKPVVKSAEEISSQVKEMAYGVVDIMGNNENSLHDANFKAAMNEYREDITNIGKSLKESKSLTDLSTTYHQLDDVDKKTLHITIGVVTGAAVLTVGLAVGLLRKLFK